MKKELSPFRITLILGDEKPVAQVEHMERIIEDDGSIVTSRVLPAEPLAVPLSETILGAVNAASLARIAELETAATGHAADLETLTTEKTAAESALAQRTTELEAANARITELTAPPPPDETADLVATLTTMFRTTLPPEAQAQFAVPYAIVRVLVQAGEIELALAVVSGIEVPPELESAKTGLIDAINQASNPTT